MPLSNEKQLRAVVEKVVRETPVTDIHTHLYDPGMTGMLSQGLDDLLTYHYLVAENLAGSCDSPMYFEILSKRKQAERIWKNCFLGQSPLSEAAQGVLTSLRGMGITPGRDLDALRRKMDRIPRAQVVDRVFKAASVRDVVMTNDPFDDRERPWWDKSSRRDRRFHAGLRIDTLLLSWDKAWPRLKSWGYKVGKKPTHAVMKEVQRFLQDRIKKMDALYLMVSLPPDFVYPDKSVTSQLLVKGVLPACSKANKPLALMIGVKRGVNPKLGSAGDGVGTANVGAIENLCRDFVGNRFLVTMLARENQHALTVAARKFPNLMLFGCWWFLNVPSMVEEITRLRLELLGTRFIAQHSDSRVLEQLIYKWDMSRRVIGGVLADRYVGLLKTGWAMTEDDIRRDVAALFGGNFWKFLKGSN